jgi:two-component system, OmpR family, phosphate regulon sensor histidine kinase PhoR
VKRGTRILFYVLSAYVLIQFLWWAYYLTSLAVDSVSSSVQEDHSNKVWMIIGEGGVFLLLLFSGMIIVYRNLSKEARIARAERNFFLSVTHELKTPLASTKLLLQTLRTKSLEQSKQHELLDAALEENDRLANLTENILLAARLEHSGSILQKQPFDYSSLVENIASSFRKGAGRFHTIITEIETNIIINGDESALTSVVSNLLDNACKYSKAHSEIRLNLTKVNGEVILTVADQGVGMPDVELAHVFKKFYRAGDERTRTTKGTGLGLFIVERIARWHSAVIKVTPNKPNGCIFTLSFPA